MKTLRSVPWLLAMAGLAAVTWGSSAHAHGDDIVWSVGVGSPGVQLGVTNAPPAVVHRPVLVAPQPVYLRAPAVVLRSAAVAVPQPQVVYAVAPYPVQSQWVQVAQPRGWDKQQYKQDRKYRKHYRKHMHQYHYEPPDGNWGNN